jgi:hypothetical protein
MATTIQAVMAGTKLSRDISASTTIYVLTQMAAVPKQNSFVITIIPKVIDNLPVAVTHYQI